MSSNEKPILYFPIDPEQTEDETPKTRRSHGWVILAGMLSLMAFMVYTKTPYHINNCIHHITKHVSGVASVKKIEPRSTTAENKTSVCTTPACVDYANRIKASLAKNYTKLDPCEDFNVYACQGWIDSHDWRADQSSVSVGSVMSDTIRNLLHSILEGKYTNNSTHVASAERNYDLENFQMMKDAYDTCMDQDGIKAYGIKPVKDILDQFEKVFPREGKPVHGGSNEELTDTVIWLGKHSVSGLVSSDTSPDEKNPDKVVIGLGGTELSFAKAYYSKPQVIANWTKAVQQMRQVLITGKTIEEEPIPESKLKEFTDYSKGIADFELMVSKNIPDPEKASEVDYYYQPRTIAEVEKLVPEISVTKLLKAFVPPEYPITPDLTVIVNDIDYYKNLSTIIKLTPREALHDYFRSRLVATWAGRLHRNFTAPSRAFSNVLAGKDPNNIPDRWRTCVSEVDANLGYILSGAFIERAFSAADKKLGDRIIADIKQVFAQRLQAFEWMTPAVKEAAAKKVVNIIQKIGYQTKDPDTSDPESIHKFYTNLKVTKKTTYFENGWAYAEFARNRSWNDLLHPYNRNRWGMTSPTVNAYYSPSGNEIVFPAGIMQPPVFSAELPEYVSYGAFGSVAGHELTHGFDNHGSHFDQNGVLRDWWDNTTITNFDKKTQCFIGQYSKFTVVGLDGEPLHVNGKLTLGENIADAGGLTASYSAWKQRDKDSPNPSLPGLEEFTKDQLFFIAYSNWWCGKVRPAQKVSYVYSDPHSPNDKRVIGTTANSKAFREAFNCKVKEPTCELW